MSIENDWARTFDTKDGQMLFYYVYDPEEEIYEMHCILKHKGCTADAKFSLTEEDDMKKLFNSEATQEAADAFVNKFMPGL